MLPGPRHPCDRLHIERAARIQTVGKFSLDGETLRLEALVHGEQQHWNLWGTPLSSDPPAHPVPPVPAT